MTPAQAIFAARFPTLVAHHGLQRYFATTPLTPSQLDVAANRKAAIAPVKPVSKFACNQRWEKDRIPPAVLTLPGPKPEPKRRYVLSPREQKGIPSRAQCRRLHLCLDCGQPAKELKHGHALQCEGCLELAAQKRRARS